MTTHEYQTTRIWKATHRRLRIVAAHTGESMVEVLDRLAREEFRRLRLPELSGTADDGADDDEGGDASGGHTTA